MTCAAQPLMRETAKTGVNSIFIDAQHVVSGGRVEIHVGVQLLFRLHELLDLFRHLIPLGLPAGTAEIPRHRTQVRGSWIFGVIRRDGRSRESSSSAASMLRT